MEALSLSYLTLLVRMHPDVRCNLPSSDLTPSKHNAARAQYDRSAALYSRALKSPSGDVCVRSVPRFNDNTRLGVT
jgi:hypothetical protein